MCSISLDSLSLNKWIEQNRKFLEGARIQKIQQPTRRNFVLAVRNLGVTKKLYIDINPKYYHVCFMSKENEAKRLIEIPQKPPMFCMQLRKYLENAVISKVSQPQYERILELYIETYNELSERIYLCLAVELMGKHSNVVLYNYDTNIILGCAHNVGSEKSRERELAGTLPYVYPPNPPNNWYVSPDSFSNFEADDINSIIDNYYADVIYEDKFNTIKDNYKYVAIKKIKKYQNSLDKMKLKLKSEIGFDKYRKYGDLIMANIYNLRDYSSSVEVFDWEDDKNIIIELNENKNLKDNAAEFYKIYNKSKHSNVKLQELISELEKDINYCEHILYSIEISDTIADIKEVAFEIDDKSTVKPDIKSAIKPLELEYEGCKIYVGRNNRQNDYIISKMSKDEDYWFHTKDCAGSHVLLICSNPSDKVILRCAELAKQYSKGAQSSKVGVIYTKRKNLKKPPKANLGYVTYKNEKEIVV